jgi:quercetin dioxygenase-like cupin family protein
MEEAFRRESIAKQDNFIIIKVILKKDAVILPHKCRGLTTLIPVKGQGIIMRNTEAIAIRLCKCIIRV